MTSQSITVLSGVVCSVAVTAVYSEKMEVELDDILMWEGRPLSGTECTEVNLTGKAFMHWKEFNLICLKGILSSRGRMSFVKV